jgi:hypothetical protein
MNLNEALLKSANDYQLIIYIKEKYIQFRQIRGGGTYIYNPINTEPLEEELPEEKSTKESNATNEEEE